MIHNRIHPAKVVLFGEYSVLLGSASLGIPYRAYGAAPGTGTANPEQPALSPVESHQSLERFAGYLLDRGPVFHTVLDLSRLSRDIGNGLYLHSTIPPQRGLGSSAALCAALFERYRRKSLHDWPSLKGILGKMESYFHGTSSGFDPLISLLDRPLWLTQRGKMKIRPFSTRLLRFSEIYLADLGCPSGTGHLVGGFLERHTRAGRPSAWGQALATVTERCIEGLMNEDVTGFLAGLRTLSRMQAEGLPGLVPDQAMDLWKEGLASSSYTMKLCGSGGGGYFLVFVHNPRRAMQVLRDVPLENISASFNPFRQVSTTAF